MKIPERFPPIPEAVLIHSIDYKEVTEKDSWGNSPVTPSKTINKVRVETNSTLTKSQTQAVKTYDAVIYMDAVYSKPFIKEILKDSTVAIGGKDYKVKEVKSHNQPGVDEIHHHKIGVVSS